MIDHLPNSHLQVPRFAAIEMLGANRLSLISDVRGGTRVWHIKRDEVGSRVSLEYVIPSGAGVFKISSTPAPREVKIWLWYLKCVTMILPDENVTYETLMRIYSPKVIYH